MAATATDPWLTIAAAAEALRGGEVSSTDLTHAALDRIAATDERVRAFITVTAERALEAAGAADDLLRSGDASSPLTGVPIGLKDVLMTKGVRTTAGSRMLDSLIAAVRRHLGPAPQRRPCGVAGQDEHGRVCDGLLDRAFSLVPHF